MLAKSLNKRFQYVNLAEQILFKIIYSTKLDLHIVGKWLVYGIKHRNENQLQSQEPPEFTQTNPTKQVFAKLHRCASLLSYWSLIYIWGLITNYYHIHKGMSLWTPTH